MKTYSYGKQHLELDDYIAVLKTLASPFLTCGPKVSEFERAICDYTGAKYCVAVNSATSGLHIAMLAAKISTGDEVITSPITFVSSANCVRFVGASVKFADINADTANIDPKEIKKHITEKTKAIIPVHFAGQSCDMIAIKENLPKDRKIYVIEDAAHAIGSEYNGVKVGSCQYSDMAVFSFHPVKTITTCEGGAVTTNDEELYKKLLAYRAHGLHTTTNWKYDMIELGFNYRMNDVQAALGITQLKKLDKFKKRRREIVEYYNHHLGLSHLVEKDFSNACFHLYVILVENRENFYHKARQRGLNLQVHYIPVHTQPYYQQFGYKLGDYPNAEKYYERCISLPLYYDLKDKDLKEIIKRIKEIM